MQAQADYKKTAEKDVKSFVQNWEFPYGVEMATNSQDESMGEELSALGMLAGLLLAGLALFLFRFFSDGGHWRLSQRSF